MLELKKNSMMSRLSGWMPTAIRGDQSPADLVLSLAVRELEEDSFIFALCQDHKLRMWSFRVRAPQTQSTMNTLSLNLTGHVTLIQNISNS